MKTSVVRPERPKAHIELEIQMGEDFSGMDIYGPQERRIDLAMTYSQAKNLYNYLGDALIEYYNLPEDEKE